LTTHPWDIINGPLQGVFDYLINLCTRHIQKMVEKTLILPPLVSVPDSCTKSLVPRLEEVVVSSQPFFGCARKLVWWIAYFVFVPCSYKDGYVIFLLLFPPSLFILPLYFILSSSPPLSTEWLQMSHHVRVTPETAATGGRKPWPIYTRFFRVSSNLYVITVNFSSVPTLGIPFQH